MPYYGNVPQANQRISATQAPILANFTEIGTAFNRNHQTLGTANSGNHTVVKYLQQGAEPAAFNATDAGLYNLNYLGNPEIYVRKGVAATGIPMTAGTLVNNGFSYLPSGMLIRYGMLQTGAGGTVTVDFTAIPGEPQFTNQPYVSATGIEAGAAAIITCRRQTPPNWTDFTFTIRNNTGALVPNRYLTYIMIGR